MFKLLLHKISAERLDVENPFLPPFFYQQQKAYSFCLKFVKDKNVLEVGSGNGYGANRLAKIAKNILGIDSDEIAVRKSKEKYKSNNLKFAHSKIEDYTSRQKFNVVIALQVFEHVEKPKLFLEKIASLTKSGGLLIIATPNSYTQSYNENPYHYKEYSFTELRSILSKYYKEVMLYGLSGDNRVKNFEKIRREYVKSTLNLDIFKLRKFIPRRIKQLVFDFVAFFNRAVYQRRNIKLNQEILENNYKVIKGNVSNAIDIIAVCRYLR